MPPRIIAIANHKGGTLKTTTAVNLCHALTTAGVPTLLIDTDEQCNATIGAGHTPDSTPNDILDVIMRTAPLPQTIITTQNGTDLVPASFELKNVDTYFQQKPGLHTVLKTELSKAALQHDIILIDCPGDLGNMTLAALTAATEILVPVATGSMELEAVIRFEQHLREQVELLNPDAHVTHILAGRAELHQIVDQQVIHTLREEYEHEMLTTVVPKSVRVTESYSAGQPVTLYAPSSRPAMAYRDAANELLTRDPR